MRPAGLASRLALLAVLGFAAGAASAQQSQDDKSIMNQPSSSSGSSGSSGSSSSSDSSTGTDTGAPPVEDELSTTYSSIGLEKITAKNFDNVKDAINLNFTMIGFRIPPAPWFAIELNLGFTMIPGQIDPNSGTPGNPGTCVPPDSGLPPGCIPSTPGTQATGSGDFSATTAGVFGVLRSTGSVFAMGKYGYRYLSTSIDQLQNDRSGNAWGAGIGYRWNKKGSYAEFGYTHYSSELSALGFSLSYSYDRR